MLKTPEEREEINAYQRAWRKRHRASINKTRTRWNALNPERVKAMAARTVARGRGPSPVYLRNWRLDNPGKASEYNLRKYYKDPVKSRAIGRIHTQNRRGRTAGPGLSLDIVPRLLAAQLHRCVYCPADLRVTGHHLDHRTPLSRDGRHEDANMQLTCPACNQRKFTLTHEEFVAQRSA